MRKELKMLSMIYLFMLIMLFVPSFFSGALYVLSYFLSLLLPLGLGVLLSVRCGRKAALTAPLIPRGSGILKSVPVIPPTLFLITGISFLTSLLIFALTGKENAPSLGESLPLAIFTFALLPAVMEELLFRYIPLVLIGTRSPRVCILSSALFFALVHHSFFSMPYAFFAGLVFMALDLYAGCIYPSLIAHFLNNLLSVFWIFYSGTPSFALAYFGGLLALSAASLWLIFAKRKRYIGALRRLLSGSEKWNIPPEAAVLTAASLLMAIIELL